MTLPIAPVRPAIPDTVPSPDRLADLLARAPRAPIVPSGRPPVPVPMQPPRPITRPAAHPRMPGVGVVGALATVLTIADLAEQFVAPRWFDWLEQETGWRHPRKIPIQPLPPLTDTGEYIPYNLRYRVMLREATGAYSGVHEGMLQLTGPILAAYWDWSHPRHGTAVPRRLSTTGHYNIPWVVVIGAPNPDAGRQDHLSPVVSGFPRWDNLVWEPLDYRIEPANPSHRPLPTISPHPNGPVPLPYHPHYPAPQPQQRPLPVRPFYPDLPIRVRPCVPDTLPTRPDLPILIPVRVPYPVPVPTPYPVPVPVPTPYPVPVRVPHPVPVPTPYPVPVRVPYPVPVPVPTPYPVPVTVPQPNPVRVPVPVVVPYETPRPIVWERVAPPVKTRPPVPDIDASLETKIRYLVTVSTIIADTSCPDPCPPCDCDDNRSEGGKPNPVSLSYVVRSDGRCQLQTGVIHAASIEPPDLAERINATAQMALEGCGREPVAAIPESWVGRRTRRDQLTIIYRSRRDPRGHYQITIPHWVWSQARTQEELVLTPYRRGTCVLIATHEDNTRVIIRAVDEQTARRVYGQVIQGQASQIAASARIEIRQRETAPANQVEPYKCNFFTANNLTSHPDWVVWLTP